MVPAGDLTMAFAWPLALLSLLVLPVLVAIYLWQIRHRRRGAVRYSSVALIRAAAPRRSAWRRHVPFALLLAVLACLGLAAARPQLRADVPVAGSAIILAVDVSGSMCATDVDPNRLTAAQAAVRNFVRRQDTGTRIGLVVFSGHAQVAVSPTTERDELLKAIDTLVTGRGTTIGAAILKSVDAIAAINDDVQPTGSNGLTGLDPGFEAEPQPAPRRAGSHAPEIVVLLTDGANTRGIEPVEAAGIAASRGVRVYPIGFGTQNPTTLVCSADQLGGDFDPRLFGPPGSTTGPPRNFLVADETTLKKVASATGGAYFAASDADQLQRVLKDLPRRVDMQERNVEVSVALVGLAAVLMLLTFWAAARWTAFPA